MLPYKMIHLLRPAAGIVSRSPANSCVNNFVNIANNLKFLRPYAAGNIDITTDKPQIPSKGLAIKPNISKVPQAVEINTDILDAELSSIAEVETVDEQPSKSLEPDDLLEKHFAGLSANLHQKHRVYKNDFMRILTKIKENNFSTIKQGLQLLNCCTELLPDEPPSERMLLAEMVWNTLKPHTKFTIDHYNALLKCYIANKKPLNAATFIANMKPLEPATSTYELILQALGESGDLNQATEVLENMKSANKPVTEKVFNSLIVCQGKNGNLSAIDQVLTMMKSLKLTHSVDTQTAIIKAYFWNNKTQEALDLMEKSVAKYEFQEHHIMDIVKVLAERGLPNSVDGVLKHLPKKTKSTPSISPYMQSVATQLVYMNQPLIALKIYKILPLPAFGPKDDKGLHGRGLIRDCVKAAMPSSVIAQITEELVDSGRNPIALQSACEAALQLGKTQLAFDLFTRMKHMHQPLRPHYFWPLLVMNAKSFGEKGIMNVLYTMQSMEVQPDFETMLEYVLPYVSFSSPQNLMKKFLDVGLTPTMCLTPMMVTLLKTGQLQAACELSELFDGKIDSQKLLKPLLEGYIVSFDYKRTVRMLEDICDKSTHQEQDWLGKFLCNAINNKAVQGDFTYFDKLLKYLNNTNLKISTSATDYIVNKLPHFEKVELRLISLKNQLVSMTDDKIPEEIDISVPQIQHPRDMNEASLKAHLVELEAKGMNTRGVLRKLLQVYLRENNLKSAKEIVQKCQKEGVYLSAGMKASIFDLHVKFGELEEAEASLEDLNKSSPNFVLDEFKVIDFATLLVYKKKIDRAFEVIKKESSKRRVVGGKSIESNCWRLLDAIAQNGTPEQTKDMFELLTNNGYCKPSNVILGPLIRVHLKNENLANAISEFVSLADKYKKTPLKHELLCKVLICMNDGKSEDNFVFNEKTNNKMNKMAQTILDIDKKIHGRSDVQLTLISALAEVGYKKTLRKLLSDPTTKVHPDALMRQCKHFADEKKLSVLDNIAECCKDLRFVNTSDIYDIILSVYQRENECQGAISLWTKMQESDVRPNQKFISNLASLLKANKYNIPPEIVSLLDKENRVKS